MGVFWDSELPGLVSLGEMQMQEEGPQYVRRYLKWKRKTISSDLGRWCVPVCVCMFGEDAKWHGRVVKKIVFPSHYLLPNPTNLPPISIPSRKKSGTPCPVMSSDVWLCGNEIELLKINTPESLYKTVCPCFPSLS